MSTRTDDDVRIATNDVVGAGWATSLQSSSRTIGRTGLVAFHWRRSTTVKPARSNIVSVPWKAFADGMRSPVGTSTG